MSVARLIITAFRNNYKPLHMVVISQNTIYRKGGKMANNSNVIKPKYKVFMKLCKANNVTPYRVAADLGIVQSTFTDWKNERSCPKIGKMLKLADYFDVPLQDFYERR